MKLLDLANILFQQRGNDLRHSWLTNGSSKLTEENKDSFSSIMQDMSEVHTLASLIGFVPANQEEASSLLLDQKLDEDKDLLEEDVSDEVHLQKDPNDALKDLGLTHHSVPSLINTKHIKGKDKELYIHILEGQEIEIESAHEVHDETIYEELLGQLQDLLTGLSLFIHADKDQISLESMAKSLYQFMQRLSSFPLSTQANLQKAEFSTLLEAKEEGEVLQDLLRIFQKRHTFQKHQIYQSNASIAVEDVQKWLQQALIKYDTQGARDENRPQVYIPSKQSIPMTPLEQYTLHIKPTDRVDAISRNLVTDLQQIINRSQFLRQPGIEQLTLRLQPQSLGDVTIRLLQVNGEMTVKFLVTSQAARDLFESNIHQLKPLFSPNHISIERDTSINDEEYYGEEQHDLDEGKEEEAKDEAQEKETNNEAEKKVNFEDLLEILSKETVDEYAKN